MASALTTRARLLLLAALVLLSAAAVLAAVTLGSEDDGRESGPPEATQTPTPTPSPSGSPSGTGSPRTWRIGTLNALGAGHTSPHGNKTGWARGPQRMEWLSRVIARRGLDVLALQEFERPQYDVFVRELGDRYSTYPGTAWGRRNSMRNSVAWRTDRWRLVDGRSVTIPYFHGNPTRMPVVRLRDRETGREAWFTSFHNPASVHGSAKQWRDRATDIEARLANRLRDRTGVPVFLLGDMNAREGYFCRMTAAADLIAANGGTRDASDCDPPDDSRIDWIFGPPQVTFTDYRVDRAGLIRMSTDHPLVSVEVRLPGRGLG